MKQTEFSLLTRAVVALEKLATCVEDGVFQMRDVDRAQVYSEHLGEKLKKDSNDTN